MAQPGFEPLHPLLLHEVNDAKTRTEAEWADVARVRQIAAAFKKHKDKEKLLSQTYGLAIEMHKAQAQAPALFYLSIAAIILGDEILATQALAGAIDAAAVASTVGSHVNKVSLGPKDALGPRTSKGAGVRPGPKKR